MTAVPTHAAASAERLARLKAPERDSLVYRGSPSLSPARSGFCRFGRQDT